jgi:hypothetical protein
MLMIKPLPMPKKDLLQLVVPMRVKLERLAYVFAADDHFR